MGCRMLDNIGTEVMGGELCNNSEEGEVMGESYVTIERVNGVQSVR